MPAVNIQDNTDHFAIDLAVPAFKKDDLKVQMKDGVHTISIERKAGHEEEKMGYTRKEWSFAAFGRSFGLPENTDAKSLMAKYDDGPPELALMKTKADTESKAKEVNIGRTRRPPGPVNAYWQRKRISLWVQVLRFQPQDGYDLPLRSCS